MTGGSETNDVRARSVDAERAAEETRYRELLTAVERHAVPALVAFLGDPSWRVRRAAVRALGELRGTPTLVPALVAGMASSDNAGLRNACVEVLLGIGIGAVGELVQSLSTPDPDHRKFIVEALGGISSPEAARALAVALDDPDDNVRSAAVEALGRTGGHGALEILRRRLAAPNTDLLQRVYVLDALGHLKARLGYEELKPWIHETALTRVLSPLLGFCGDPRAGEILIDGLEHGPKRSREVAVQALATLFWDLPQERRAPVAARLGKNESTRAALLELLATVEEERLAGVIEVLVELGDPVLAPAILSACARGKAADVGLAAVQRLGPAIVPPLLAAIDAADIESRVLFLEAVEVLGDSSVVPTLLEIAAEPETRATETAVRVIGELAGPEAVTELMKLARSGDVELRQATVMALAGVGRRHPHVVADRLRRVLAEGDARPEWIAALGAIGRAEDLEVLVSATHHRESEVRRSALDAALSFGLDFPEEILVFALTDEQPRVRVAAARALSAYRSPTAGAALLVATRDVDAWVVAEAIHGLGSFRTPEAVATLKMAALSSSSPVAIAALQGLLRLNPPGLEQVAARAVSHADPEVAREAVALTMRLPESEARTFLGQCLGHRSWVVRGAAVEALLTRHLKVAPSLVEERLRDEDETLVREPLERLLALHEGSA